MHRMCDYVVRDSASVAHVHTGILSSLLLLPAGNTIDYVLNQMKMLPKMLML